MAWYSLTHTPGPLATGLEPPTVARRLRWALPRLALTWSVSVLQVCRIGSAGFRGARRQTAGGWLAWCGADCWGIVSQVQRDAQVLPGEVRCAGCRVRMRQIVAAAADWLKAPQQLPPGLSEERALQDRPGMASRAGELTEAASCWCCRWTRPDGTCGLPWRLGVAGWRGPVPQLSLSIGRWAASLRR